MNTFAKNNHSKKNRLSENSRSSNKSNQSEKGSSEKNSEKNKSTNQLTSLTILFGMGYATKPDVLRVSNYLSTNPTTKVITVNDLISYDPRTQTNEHKKPKFTEFKDRYLHINVDFKDKRGIKSLVDQINTDHTNDGLEKIAILDYAWLQLDYYQAKYGLNWFMYATKSKEGKCTDLFKIHGMRAIYLPCDKVKSAMKKMVNEYNAQGDKTLTIIGMSRDDSLKYHPLVLSDIMIAEKLNLEQREPNYQMERYLSPDTPFYFVYGN
jgi:hypothetical protein